MPSINEIRSNGSTPNSYSKVTVYAVVRLLETEGTGSGTIIGDATGNPTWGLKFENSVAGWNALADYNTGARVKRVDGLTRGVWYLVTAIFDLTAALGDAVRIYINGSDAAATDNAGEPTFEDPFQSGQRLSSSTTEGVDDLEYREIQVFLDVAHDDEMRAAFEADIMGYWGIS